MGGRQIANKYREGMMKRTLKRELKVPEIVKGEGKCSGAKSRVSGQSFGQSDMKSIQ